MAVIAPFRGIRYSCGKPGVMADLVGPPFDLSSEADREIYRERHKYNITRLLYCDDPEGGRAQAAMLQKWRADGCLLRESEPAFYLYQIDFREDEESPLLTRTGFIGLLRLDEYEMGIVRPHERTFTAVKEERLEALAGCRASLSQIMTFYDDPEQAVVGILRAAAPEQPAYEFADSEGIGHRLWVISDPEAIREVAAIMAAKQIFIADGHHRYETCLAHRSRMRWNDPQADPRAPFNYTLVYAAAMQDPGLAILPAHRLLRRIDGFVEKEFLKGISDHFEVIWTGLDPDSKADRHEFRTRLEAEQGRSRVIGFVSTESSELSLLRLRPEVLEGLQYHPALKDLDVVALREIIVRRKLGFSSGDLDNDRLMLFESNLTRAIRLVKNGRARVGFLLNPTRVSQVKAVADAGLVMPPKSTLFFPKVTTGLTMSPMPENELVEDVLG